MISSRASGSILGRPRYRGRLLRLGDSPGSARSQRPTPCSERRWSRATSRCPGPCRGPHQTCGWLEREKGLEPSALCWGSRQVTPFREFRDDVGVACAPIACVREMAGELRSPSMEAQLSGLTKRLEFLADEAGIRLNLQHRIVTCIDDDDGTQELAYLIRRVLLQRGRY